MRSELPGPIPRLLLVEAIRYSKKSKGLDYGKVLHYLSFENSTFLNLDFLICKKRVITCKGFVRFKLKCVCEASTVKPAFGI